MKTNQLNIFESDTACKLVAGVDEVGRGPLAGPVVAAAVILDEKQPIDGLKDSKKLTHKKRLLLTEMIKQKSIAWSIASCTVEEVDSLNILQASLLAMTRAVESLSVMPELALVDGNKLPKLSIPAKAIVKGDSLVEAISAASIIAKVERDLEMERLDKVYPGYGLGGNKGYPTAQHLSALKSLGITDIHRKSYKPVKDLL